MHMPTYLNANYTPAGHFVPVFAASPDLKTQALTLALAKSAAKTGKTVLMLDGCSGGLMKKSGIIYNKTLSDAVHDGVPLNDIKYVTSNEHFTAIPCGNAPFEDLMGAMLALSLNYDWTFIALPAGCTPAHVRLAAASDISLLNFSTQRDLFMRAYWMMEAIRARAPKFDPLLLSYGPQDAAGETTEMLRETLREFLGAPPAYAGHRPSVTSGENTQSPTFEESPVFIERLLHQLREVARTDAAQKGRSLNIKIG